MYIPQGYRFASVACGIKKSGSADCTLIVSDRDATGAGVYTQNLVFAAPVALDRQRTPSPRLRGVVVNSGNANACTGDRGFADAQQMARLAARAAGASEDQMLVMSTGVIGNFLPMDKVEAGIAAAGAKLTTGEEAVVAAAKGIMTTDTVHKLVSKSVATSRGPVAVLGLCKGAAMIGPNMATMLGVVLTDAALEPAVAQRLLSGAVDDSFNCLSVEGHMSTNDTVLLLANGAAGGGPLAGADLAAFEETLKQVCMELAKKIADDGEGATHVITLTVEGCADREAAQQIAKTVANSPLVKAAIHGADPNWGRIVSAAGYAGVKFNPQGVRLHVQGFLLYENGRPASFDAAAVSAAIRNQRETDVVLSFSEGQGKVRFWTTDLTAEYVRLNADYTT